MKKLILAVFCLLTVSTTSAQTHRNFWQPLTSKSLPDGGPISGSINGITIDSLNRIYLETGGDGVLQSTDGGDTWHGFNQGLRVLPFKNLASSTIEFDSVNHIFVAYVYGVSQRNEVMRRLFNTRSIDSRWEYLTDIVNQDGVRDPTPEVNEIMTNRKGYLFLATSLFGILRSTTHGIGFDKLTSLKAPKPDSFIVCMAIHRPTQDIYCVSQSNVFQQSQPSLWINHLSKSTDDGVTWTRLPSLPPYPTLIQKILIADDGSILLGYHHNTYDTNNLTRIYRSSDHGVSWQSVKELPRLKESDVDTWGLTPRGHDIYVNIHGPTFRSTDNGATWTDGNQEKMGEETFHMAIDTNNRVFQVAIPDGCFRSDDNGVTFRDKDSDLAVQHMDGGIVVNSKGCIFAASQFNMYRSCDNGGGWDNLTNELDEAVTPYFSLDHEDRLFYGSYWGYFRSTDNGNTFDTIIKSHPDALAAEDKQNQIYYHGVNAKDEIFVSSSKDPLGNPGSYPWFVRSNKHGDPSSWVRLNNATADGQFSIKQTEQIGCFDFSPATGDTIFASGVTTGVIYRSTNDGTNWVVCCHDSAVGSIIQFICHPDGSVFRLQSGGQGNGSDGLYHSTDNGVTWIKVFPADTLAIPHYSFVKPLLLDRKGRILICTFGFGPGDNMPVDSITGVVDTMAPSGIYISRTPKQDPTFRTWDNVTLGFTGDDWYNDIYHNLNASQIAQNSKTGYYYGNSRGRSVFVSTWPDFDSTESGIINHHLPSSVTEPLNYPNPFSRTTQISFDVPQSGNVRISMYDVMGRLVQVIANAYMDAGQHTLPFDANSAITSGQYMLVVESGSDRISHWMTITK